MKFKINDLEIDVNSKPYLIAEVSANHNGSIDRALKLIEIAKKKELMQLNFKLTQLIL